MSFEQQICDQIPHLRRYATALCGDPGAADDLVQDCLERALRKRHLWRPSGRLRSWLFRMLYRLYINQRTSAPVRKEQPRADAGLDQTVAADQEDHVECQQALEALDQLPTEQRAALLLAISSLAACSSSPNWRRMELGDLNFEDSWNVVSQAAAQDGDVVGYGHL